MKLKIFEGTLRSAINRCVKEGYTWADAALTYKFMENRKIQNQYYTTSTFYSKGEFLPATKEQIKNIESEYEKGKRAIVLGKLGDWSDAVGYDGRLGGSGARLVGVKK